MDVDTAVVVPLNIMPLLDDTDFKTIETGLVYNAAGLVVHWNFVTPAGVMTSVAITPTTGDDHDISEPLADIGMYAIEIPASAGDANNDTEGVGWITGKATGILPWRGPTIGFRRAALNDLFIEGGTASTNLEDFFDGTGYAGGTAKLGVNVATITNDAITAAAVANGAIDAATFAAGAIDATAIANGAITAAAIAADAITAAKIADGAIDAATFAAGAITAAAIATGAIDADAIADNAIDAGAIAADAITAAKIANGAIDNATFAADVGSTAYATNVIALAADKALVQQNLDHLAAVATVAADMTAEMVDDSILARIIGNGDTSTFVPSTDGLHAAGVDLDAILADTNELQVEWADGGRLDLLLDGASAPSAATVADAVWDEVLDTAHEVAGSASVLLQAASAPSAAAVADAVWDEVLDTAHEVAGSASVLLQASGAAADPWLTALPGAYGAGTAGKIVGDNINAPIATVDTVVDGIATALATVDDFLDTEIAAILADTNELQTDWVNGGRLDLLLDTAASQAGTGLITCVVTVHDGDSNDIGAANVWVTSDVGGSTIVVTGVSNDTGTVTFYLDAGTYYVWGQKAGYTFTNPDTFVVAADSTTLTITAAVSTASTATLASLRDRVEATLQDSGNATWSTADIDEAIRKALDRHNRTLPRQVIGTITLAAAGREISLASLTGLIEVKKVWWDYDSTDPGHPPTFRDFEVWPGNILYINDPTEPAATEVVRVWYTVPYTIESLDDATATTLETFWHGVLIINAAAYAAQSRAIELAESATIDGGAQQRLLNWAQRMFSETQGGK
jgi:hypothetical protein